MSISIGIVPGMHPERTARVTGEAEFWDRIARKYAAAPVKNVAAYAATLDRVRRHLRPEDRALEVGCGTGSTALALAGQVAHYTGTDISPGMIAIAREKLAESAVGNLDFAVTPVVDTRFEPAAFDVVLGFNILHLVDDLGAAATRAHQLLKPGGLLISKTPCLGEMSRLLRLAIPVMRLFGKAPGVLSFTKAELETKIAQAGFEIIESRTFVGAPHNRFVVARKV